MKNTVAHIALTLLISACSLLPTQLPREIPEDLTINYRYLHGRGLWDEQLVLGKNTCLYKKRSMSTTRKYTCTLPAADFKKLYALLSENRFDRISQYDRMDYDRSITSIAVKVGGTVWTKTSGATTGVSPQSKSQWKTVVTGILKLKKKVLQGKKPVKSLK